MAAERLSGSEIIAWARADALHATLAANAQISSDEINTTMQIVRNERVTTVSSALLGILEERRQEFADEAAVAQMIVADIDGMISTVGGPEHPPTVPTKLPVLTCIPSL